MKEGLLIAVFNRGTAGMKGGGAVVQGLLCFFFFFFFPRDIDTIASVIHSADISFS